MNTQIESHETEQTKSKTEARLVSPKASLVENLDGYELQVEMPGVGPSGLDVNVENGRLTVVGNRGEPSFQAEPVYRETRPVVYRRIFEISPAIDAARIEARIENGILNVRLPKSESLKPRKIVVSA